MMSKQIVPKHLQTQPMRLFNPHTWNGSRLHTHTIHLDILNNLQHDFQMQYDDGGVIIVSFQGNV